LNCKDVIMPAKSSAGLAAGLVAEAAVIGLVVALLPKVQLEPASGNEIADERPSLAPERLPPVEAGWRTAVSRPETKIELPPADPEYVERRLDEASQQLLSGVTKILAEHAQEVMQPKVERQDLRPAPLPPAYANPTFARPGDFRY
jgi:DNA-binding transcriptional regulator YdaS (Cro superfamily)